MKVDMLMDNFVGIMQTLNEKKEIMTQAYPDKAIEVERRLASRMTVTSRQYTLQKRIEYVVAKNV